MSGSGAMTAEAEAYLAAQPGTQELDAFLIDLSGNPIGKRYPASELAHVYAEGSTFCAATPLVDIRGVAWDVMGRGFSDGDPDTPTRAVAGSLAPVPWAPAPRAQCLMRLVEEDGVTPLWFEPRTVLERVVERFQADGLRPVLAAELEFYLIDAERVDGGAPQPPCSPLTGQRDWAGKTYGLEILDEFADVLGAMKAACLAQRLPIGAFSSEYGPGQFEINLDHIDDPVLAADHCALMRRAVRETARAQGFDATFMSKPYAGLAGNGLQINLSVLDESGANIFDPRRADGEERLGHAVAGMQAMLPETLALYAPTLNAYRRFEPNQFTPVTLDWGENNRAVAFRAPLSDAANRRVEHRVAGADANPYLVIAGVLAAAHLGLSRRLTPSEKGEGNVGESADPRLPLTLWAALDRLRQGELITEYLGAGYVAAYADAKQAEFQGFFADILRREYEWYL